MPHDSLVGIDEQRKDRPMKTTAAVTLVAVTLFYAPLAYADTFGSGANQFDIEFVPIGDPGNPSHPSGIGSVPYVYRMGKYEISEDMINKANALGNLGITHDGRGANKPATSISWFEAAKFVNWLNTSTGEHAGIQVRRCRQFWTLGIWRRRF